MGLVYADIKLINADDVAMVKRHYIGEEEIREISINMLVDSGAYEMAINERIQEQMGFSFIEKRRALLADGRVGEFDFVGPVMVKFANRTAICSAMVLPGACDPLLGSIPMEEMDVMIHRRRQELIVNPANPDGAVLSMRGFQKG